MIATKNRYPALHRIPVFHCHSYSANAHSVISAYTDYKYTPNAAGCLLPDEPDGAAADEVEQAVFAVGEDQNVSDLAEHAGVADDERARRHGHRAASGDIVRRAVARRRLDRRRRHGAAAGVGGLIEELCKLVIGRLRAGEVGRLRYAEGNGAQAAQPHGVRVKIRPLGAAGRLRAAGAKGNGIVDLAGNL